MRSSEDSERHVLPGEAHGLAVRPSHPARKLLWIPRVLLAIPRFVFQIATEPLRQLAILQDEYHLGAKTVDVFFNEDRTFGIVPTLFLETGFGANFGVRLLHRDLFGHGEWLQLRAGFGGIYQQEYEASINTGRLLGERVRMGLSLEYEVRQNGRFSGIGNADRVSRDEADLPLGVFDTNQSVRTRYRHRVLHGRLHATQSLTDELTLRATHVWRWRKYSVGQLGRSGTPWVTEVYDRDRLVGFGGDLVSVYNELHLRWNHRVVWYPMLPVALPSEGIRIDAWAGWQTGLEADPSQFGRYGLDVQPFIELFGGNRVLRLRLRYAAVLGARRNIPFEDWPHLGGSTLLRGYGRERFRGRATLLSTVEYRYPIQPNVSGYVFMDAGRAYAALDELTLEDMRVGFGGGLLLYTESTFLVGLQVSSSIDGGVRVNFKVNTTDGTERTY